MTGFNLKDGDSLDLSPLVQDYRPGMSELDDYVRLEPRLGGTRLLVDVDGPGGGAGFESAAVLPGAKVTELTPEQLGLTGEPSTSLYFFAQTFVGGRDLYRYDPATGEVNQIADLSDAFQGNDPDLLFPGDLTLFDGELYFKNSEPNTTGFGIYTYDPGADEVSLVAGLGDSIPLYFTPLGGHLYFILATWETESSPQREDLYRYDPATGEVNLAADIFQGGGPRDLTPLDGQLYFGASAPETGRELYRYDPATGEVSLAADVNVGVAGSDPEYLTPLDGQLYFSASTPETNREVYRYDPETGEVSLAAQVAPGSNDSSPQHLTAFDGDLYFSASAGFTTGPEMKFIGRELYRYDPDTNEVSLVADIIEGSESSFPAHFTEVAGELYFGARTPEGGGLYRYNPDTGEVNLVADSSERSGISVPSQLTEFAGKLYFSASTPETGAELFAYDPDTDQITLVADIHEGAENSDPTDLTPFGSDSKAALTLAELLDDEALPMDGPAGGQQPVTFDGATALGTGPSVEDLVAAPENVVA